MDSSGPAIAGKRIIISGAGIAGLSFARALDRFWPSEYPKPTVMIYERLPQHLDNSRDGYTLGLRSARKSGGIQAMRTLGLLDETMRHNLTPQNKDTETPCFWEKDWTLISKFSAPKPPDGLPAHTVRLARRTLRNILVEALPADVVVHWERGCDNARILDSGRMEVTMDDGSKDECDLLIGADGARSKLRSCLLPDHGLEFAGVVCMMGTSRFATGKPAPLTESWGMCFSGEGIPFLTFPINDKSGVWALSYRSNTERIPIKGKEAIQRKDELLNEVRSRGHTFAEPFNQFITAVDPETLQVFNAMQRAPIQHASALSTGNVVFIGDANHAMSPFSGSGANMALMDGVELGRQLCSATQIRRAIDGFDAESSPRSRAAINRGWWLIRVLHSQGLIYWFVKTFLGIVAAWAR